MPQLQLGQVVATPGALEAFVPEYLADCLRRHSLGDWGDISDADKASNDAAVSARFRVVSAYRKGPSKLLIITEADRSVTTLLLSSEY